MNKSTSFALPAIIVTTIAGVILWTRQPRKEHIHMSCTSNIKHMATALQLYQSEWDDRFPASNWQTSITPLLKHTDLFTCSVLLPKGGHDGFAMDWHLLGVSQQTIEDPSKTVLVFEVDALAPNIVANLAAVSYSRHKNYQGRRNSSFGYADSHVKSKFEGVTP